MKQLLSILSMLALVTFFTLDAQAQIKTPSASPSSKVTQTVGLTEVTIEYSRPSMKKRTIFAADGLVPFGKVWRTGANAATKITFSDDVTVGGVALKKGAYAVLTVPSANSWSVQFHPYEKGSWSSYVDKTPAATATATVSKLPFALETFVIGTDNLTGNSADLEFIWESTIATLKLETAVDEVVMAAIDKVLAGPTANDYYTAGSYYFDSGKDNEKALAWIQKATQTDSPRFWQVRKESLVLAALGRHEEAIAAAKKSLELATAAGNNDFIKMNKDSIAKWMKM